jgi:signal transduction histidine kinase
MVTPEPIESRARFLAVLNDLTLSTSELIGSSPKLAAVLEDVKADSANQLLRLSMLGELAASLAHEIKQPIAAALIDAKVCLRALADNRLDVEAAREAASRLVKDAMRADEIIKRTTALYKKDTTQRERVAVNAVIRETAVLLQQEASASSIAIRTELAEEMPDVMADPVQLQQALMNLMLNAIEAMKDTGGELTVTSQLGEDSELLIEVRDTGVGLPAKNPHQIFESFVTTKPHGTGMGLAITRSIVESHGGRLWAIASTGPGATFLFTLPSEVGQPDTSPQGERMRADIVAPAVFPDYELTDHAGKRRKLSDSIRDARLRRISTSPSTRPPSTIP